MGGQLFVVVVQLERVHELHFLIGCVLQLPFRERLSERLAKPAAKLVLASYRPYSQQVRIDCRRVRRAGVQPEFRYEIDAEAREVRDVRAIVFACGAQHVLRLRVQRAHIGVERVPMEQLLAAHLHSRVCDRYDTPVERQVVLEEREAAAYKESAYEHVSLSIRISSALSQPYTPYKYTGIRCI